jgi:BirA family biotin operon repressor/biotin-[acetyl-CoA-carboxylase] ligase
VETAVPFLSADEVRAGTFVRYVEIHAMLDSTNNRALDLARDPAIECPALIVARDQTAGRGRGANKWWSADGALTFSLLVEPAAHGITAANWPQLSLATAVAVCDSLEPICDAQSKPDAPRPAIKWPNDVLVDGRKIAGILVESPGGPSPAKDRLVLGIGINVNNSCRRAAPFISGESLLPSEVASATALCDVSGRQHELQQLLVALLRAIDERITQLAAADPQLPASWQRLSYLTGRAMAVVNNGGHASGRCLGIASDGAIVVDTPEGRQHFYSGSVQLDGLPSGPVSPSVT